MTKRTQRRRPKKRRPDFLLKNKLLLLILGVAGLLVFSMVFFARMEEQPSAPAPKPVAKPQVGPLKKVHAEVEAFLAALNVSGNDIQRDLTYEPARYMLEGAFPAPELVDGFKARIQQLPGDYLVRFRESNSLTVEKNRRTLIVLHFVSPKPDLPDGPLVTIIMDDLGRSLYTAEALLALPQAVTFAIIPGEAQAVQVAELAYAGDREVMLHTPMEPQGYPAVNPGEDALFVEYSDQEIRRRLDEFLAYLPHVTGINNHMGSRFTEDARALTPVMKSLQEKGLFFVDSRTTGRTLAAETARRYNVPTMERDVFLDNVAEVDAIVTQIQKLEAKARKQGMAIGICHPYPETLEALRRELPGLVERGISLVPVSVLLQKQALAQGS
ncbi:MAG TPA: divergent polysaccharide deacetylase family protein [Desulfuromonadales bacterium]|nr:divergent polysaccharide deacetylase family protein [Desulfuromonadales bacterium]